MFIPYLCLFFTLNDSFLEENGACINGVDIVPLFLGVL